MPSIGRFSFLPVIVTSCAAAGGLLGAFVAVGVLSPSAGPPKKAAPVAQEIKAAPTQAAETTASAPSGGASTSADCGQQTWPNLSQVCRDELQRKSRSVRVISPDRIGPQTVDGIESPAAKNEQPGSPPAGGAVQQAGAAQAATADHAAGGSLPVATNEPWFNPAAPGAPMTPATTAPSASAPPAPQQAAAPPAAPAPQDEAKSKPKLAKKAKRKSPSPADDSDDDRATVAGGNTQEPADDHHERRSSRQRPHIVARWIERDDGSSDDRRVAVHRGGLFENLFGLNRAKADDDDDD
jgi:hypothetical protein